MTRQEPGRDTQLQAETGLSGTEHGPALKEVVSRNLPVWTTVVTTITGGTSAIQALPLLGASLQRLQIRLPGTRETRTMWFNEGPRG